MTVYELIQDLAHYNPDSEVIFNAKFKFDTEVTVEVQRGEEYSDEKYDAEAEFDGDLEIDSIDSKRNYRNQTEVIISLEY